MHLLDLPFDVLSAVLDTCNRPSLNAISLASSQCKHLATPYLLRTVRLDRDPGQVVAFLEYIFFNTWPCLNYDGSKQVIGAGTHVRIFEILYPTRILTAEKRKEVPVSIWAHFLTRALSFMPNLRAITIRFNVDLIVDWSPAFASTLLSRPQLHTIDLSGLTSLTSEKFGRAMASSGGRICLQRVMLNLSGFQTLQLVADEGIGSIILHSWESLTEIAIRDCNLNGLLCRARQTGGCNDVDRVPVVFPNVTNMSLFHCILSSHTLSHSFPSVHSLTIRHSTFMQGNTCNCTHTTSRTTSPMLFPNLSTLQGFYADVTTFVESYGPYDHLRQIVIQDVWKSAEDILEGNMFVSLAFPHLRSLHFILSGAKTCLWWKELTDSSPHLKFLAFNAHLTNAIDFDMLCVTLPQLLGRLPLEYLALDMSILALRCWEPQVCQLSTDVSVALSYARSIPTLKYFEFLGWQMGSRRSWWRVVHESSGIDGQNDGFGVWVREIDEEDGNNRREFFDCNW